MSQLQLVPDSPEIARGARVMRPNVSRLVVVRDPPSAFPAIRPPKTPLLDQALAEEQAREAAAKKPHLFHSERVLDVDSMKHVSRTWCLLSATARSCPAGRRRRRVCAIADHPVHCPTPAQDR